MKLWLAALLLWQVADLVPPPVAVPAHLRYRRTLTVPAVARGGVACAALDAAVYAHGAESLKDLRLFRGVKETPFALTLSEPAESESLPAVVRNLGSRGSEVVFDLAMPGRSYTDVVLELGAHDFIGTAEVTGGAREGLTTTKLGSFTLFDLAGQHLGRSTTLHLQESTFAVLHVALRSSGVPGVGGSGLTTAAIRGATIPPSREAQTLYTVVTETAAVAQEGRRTVATLELPARVPSERVSLRLSPEFWGNFSRDVVVTARAAEETGEGERVTGLFERVRMERAGREIRLDQMSFPATIGANLQAAAKVRVGIENGDDPALPVRAVRLEMRERRVCFPVTAASGSLDLFYGDAALEAPRYDFARLFSASEAEVPAVLGAESLNPDYAPREQVRRSFTERHPELLWLVLLGVVCVLAVVATHSAKRMPR